MFLTSYETATRPAATALSDPPRPEILNVEKLEEFARALAAEFRVDGEMGPGTHRERLDENERRLREAHRVLAEDARRGNAISPAAEWLLDNFQLVETEGAVLQRADDTHVADRHALVGEAADTQVEVRVEGSERIAAGGRLAAATVAAATATAGRRHVGVEIQPVDREADADARPFAQGQHEAA